MKKYLMLLTLVVAGFCQTNLMSNGGGGDRLDEAACRGNCGVLSSLVGDKNITLSHLREALGIAQRGRRSKARFNLCRSSDKAISMLQQEIARREKLDK